MDERNVRDKRPGIAGVSPDAAYYFLWSNRISHDCARGSEGAEGASQG